jgi:hypothetical protein
MNIATGKVIDGKVVLEGVALEEGAGEACASSRR